MKKVGLQRVGIGCLQFSHQSKHQYSLAVYLENRPNTAVYRACESIKPITIGEILEISLACGNGWRKVFNVYSKLLYALDSADFSFQSVAPTWQIYRDKHLLQQGSGTALLFSPPLFKESDNCIHIIMGKTYVKQLINTDKLTDSLTWLDESFAIDVTKRLIVCPYFDYRQLSNHKIERLALLISGVIKAP